MIEKYQEQLNIYNYKYHKLKIRHKIISFARFFVFVWAICFYLYIKQTDLLILALLLAGASFFALMWIHGTISRKISFLEAFIAINDKEIRFLSGNLPDWDSGEEFKDPQHAYTYDLDVFGKNSLFQHLNRAQTHVGKLKLAESLLNPPAGEQIEFLQEAIAELSKKFHWRQKLHALAILIQDSKEAYTGLMSWAKSERFKMPRILKFSSYILPLIVWIIFSAALFTKDLKWGQLALLLCSCNILLIITQIKRVREEMIRFERIHKIIDKYSLVMDHIEGEDFKNSKLQKLQKSFFNDHYPASKKIKKLSFLFEQLESIHNPIGMAIINALLLYHLHMLRKILKWKEKYSSDLMSWIEAIGEFEALGSLANFSFNNPDFTFPQINDNVRISLYDMGHPLINKKNRVYNSVNFKAHSFIILTGSNMSGKSTFLRTLGINMLLANIGAPLCASSALIYPLPVLATMRLSDSLHDGESYFFAEIKRLQTIVDSLDDKAHFVLLDEILRGTNSEDKRSGTIGIIKKMLQKKALGVIATHDTEVCDLVQEYPELTNKCFEAQIANEEISFDYKLREGTCKNKSATFLMKKLNII